MCSDRDLANGCQGVKVKDLQERGQGRLQGDEKVLCLDSGGYMDVPA